MRVFAFAVASLMFAGCAVSSETPDGPSSQNEAAQSDNSCRYSCTKCPPNKVCALTCTPIGHCATTCTQFMMCAQGYQWDAKSCQCVPAPGGGEPCGASSCAPGEYCCNTSCGICAPKGSVCTQQVCTAI